MRVVLEQKLWFLPLFHVISLFSRTTEGFTAVLVPFLLDPEKARYFAPGRAKPLSDVLLSDERGRRLF